MDFKDTIKQLAQRVPQLKESILTEEATKNAFILPFINALGYDVFDPMEVVPEMDCDMCKKKGEKVDYAIMKDGKPVILMECKHWAQDLNLHDTQLQRYFVASQAKFGILSNGICYRFYTDTTTPNIMDNKPFLEVNMEDIKDFQIEELKKFHKSYFNIDTILRSASELKYMGELRTAIAKELQAPSPEFVKYFCKQISEVTFTQKVLGRFTALVKQAFNSYISDLISDRLKAAIKAEEEADEKPAQPEPIPEADDKASKVVTTDEEMEAYYIVKSILRDKIVCERIAYRDAITYFSVLIDDNNRKPVCRLYITKKSKRIVLFDGDRNEVSHKLETLDDIYNYSKELSEAAARYI